MGINTGWCNYCNGNFCPCGSCGCNSCDCSCGRKTVLQQSVPSCGGSSSLTKFCKEPVIYLTSNIIVLAAGTEIEIKVSNATKLYQGEGIQIGTYYFQITEIVDSTTIKITHNGTATPGANLTAINANYGCYQYPIYYVGVVELDYVLEDGDIVALDASGDPIADSVIDPTIVYTYGYLGPNKIEFNLEITTEIANTPNFLEIPLPEADASPSGTFSAIMIIAGVVTPLVAYKSATKLLVGPGGATQFSDGTGIIIQVSGVYGL